MTYQRKIEEEDKMEIRKPIRGTAVGELANLMNKFVTKGQPYRRQARLRGMKKPRLPTSQTSEVQKEQGKQRASTTLCYLAF